jgi:hypothetical protein
MVASKTKAIPAFFMAAILLEARILRLTSKDTAPAPRVQRNRFRRSPGNKEPGERT